MNTNTKRCAGLMASMLLVLACEAVGAAEPVASSTTRRASMLSQAHDVAEWVVASGDNNHLPFLLVDKPNAQVLVFQADGKLVGQAPALLGMARGDRLLVPNGTRVGAVPPKARITPAGRYVSRLGKDEHGGEVLVIDYEAAISLHPVVKGTPQEHRAQRLNSPTPQDNRISFGCINVPKLFYGQVVSPTFTGTRGVVYILPETQSAQALFGMQPVQPQINASEQATLVSETAPQGSGQETPVESGKLPPSMDTRTSR